MAVEIRARDAIKDIVLDRVERGCQRLIRENQLAILTAFFEALHRGADKNTSFDARLSEQLRTYGLINGPKQMDLDRVARAGLCKKEDGTFRWIKPVGRMESYYAKPPLKRAGRLKSGL